MRAAENDQREDADAVAAWSTKAAEASQQADQLRAVGDAAQADTFDDLARLALNRQLTAENDVELVQHSVSAQHESVEQLRSGLDQMNIRLSELKRRRGSVAPSAPGAPAQPRPDGALTGADIMNPASEIARFEQKLRREEARIRSQEELAASSLDTQFACPGEAGSAARPQDIADRLKALKAGRAMAAARARAKDQATW